MFILVAWTNVVPRYDNLMVESYVGPTGLSVSCLGRNYSISTKLTKVPFARAHRHRVRTRAKALHSKC